MIARLKRLVGTHRALKWVLRFYPPYLGAGVWVRRINRDLSRIEVVMPLRFYNRNYVGTHFGGSLYSMCDPFLMLMLIERLGRGYVVWDKAATIRFRRPGRGRVRAVFEVDDERLAAIRRRADEDGRTDEVFTVAVNGADGEVVAEVEKTIYVRRHDT